MPKFLSIYHTQNQKPVVHSNESQLLTPNHELYLNNNAALIISQSHVVGAPQAGHTPHPLHAVVQGALQAVRAGVPDPHCAWEKTGRWILSSQCEGAGLQAHNHKSSPLFSFPVLSTPENPKLPSSEPVMMMGNSGWKLTHDTF